MKKANVINLIKYYSEKNDIAFKQEAYLIAENFDKEGDYQLAEYIMGLLSENNVWVPQIQENDENQYVQKIILNNESLPLPSKIYNDILGIINATKHNIGVNKFLFQGAPGTGKTESVKQIARILNREIFKVNFDTLIDSKLGQTNKNIANLFDEINNLKQANKAIILFDEIDALAMERLNSNDLREMGRVTTAILKALDDLNPNILLIATTNLFKHFDKALIRRFDKVVDFNNYTNEDLIDIANNMLQKMLVKFKNFSSNKQLFTKILKLYEKIPYPGDLKNLIKISLAFSDPNEKFNYLKKLYVNVTKDYDMNPKNLKQKNFTLREIEILTGVSKSQVGRILKEKHE